MYTAQGHVITCRPDGPHLLIHKRKPGRRGVVSGYSESSRRRLKYMLARLERSSALFVTITQREYLSLDDYRRHWRTLEIAIRRRYPAVGLIVWRVEFQRRGARHLHLIIRPRPGRRIYISWRWISAVWGRLVGQGTVLPSGWLDGTPSVDVEYVAPGSPKLMAYVSKYVAKSSAPETCGSREATAQGDGASLDNSNISAQSSSSSTGRVWGVTGRRWLIYAPIRSVRPEQLTPRSLEYLEKLASWRREQGYTVVSWSAILWDRLT